MSLEACMRIHGSHLADKGMLGVASLVSQLGSIGKLIERSRRTNEGSMGATRSSTDCSHVLSLSNRTSRSRVAAFVHGPPRITHLVFSSKSFWVFGMLVTVGVYCTVTETLPDGVSTSPNLPPRLISATWLP
jgi:hypothetical protein